MREQRREDILRLKKAVSKSTAILDKNFYAFLGADLYKILSDYFEVNDKPKIFCEQNGREITVSISVSAKRVKPFSVLP